MKVQEYIERLLAHSGVEDYKVVLDEEDEDRITISISVPEKESGVMIGFHGETLASLQRLVNVIFFEQLGEKRVTLNVNDYRQRRQEALEAMVERVAHRVLESGEAHTFSYLPANERYIVHTTLSNDKNFAELSSVSQGEGSNRLLTIQLKS